MMKKNKYIKPRLKLMAMDHSPLMAGSGPTGGGNSDPKVGAKENLVWSEPEEEEMNDEKQMTEK